MSKARAELAAATPVGIVNPLSPYPSSYGTCNTREAELARREAELAQRERMLAQREEGFERQVASMSCGLGCMPSIVQHIQQPLAEVPAQWQPLVRRLWQCWVASAAGLLWNWLCVLALWASLLARGKDLLFAGGLLLLGPPAAWWGWYLPLCHASHRDSAAAPHGPRLTLLCLLAHAVGCAFVALGPSGWGVAGVLAALSLLRKQEVTLGLTLLLGAMGWLCLAGVMASLWQKVKLSGMLIPLPARPAVGGPRTPSKAGGVYAPV